MTVSGIKTITGRYSQVYEEGARLGSGGFGAVYLVTRRYRNKTCTEKFAAKKIRKSSLTAEGYVRATREYEILAEINHCNVIKLEEAFQDSEYIYLIIELCEHGDLHQFIKRNCADEQSGLGYDIASEIFVQLVSSVSYLHKHQIIHRDIKPANILLKDSECETGRLIVKLSDFGLAKKLPASPAGGAQTICGTPQFFAPEVAGRRPYDAKVDIWSLGCVLFNMLKGSAPLTDRRYNLDELLDKVESGDVVRLVQREQWLLSGAKDLLLQLLQCNPERRIRLEDIPAHPFFHRENKVAANQMDSGYCPSSRSSSARIAHSGAQLRRRRMGSRVSVMPSDSPGSLCFYDQQPVANVDGPQVYRLQPAQQNGSYPSGTKYNEQTHRNNPSSWSRRGLPPQAARTRSRTQSPSPVTQNKHPPDRVPVNTRPVTGDDVCTCSHCQIQQETDAFCGRCGCPVQSSSNVVVPPKILSRCDSFLRDGLCGGSCRNRRQRSRSRSKGTNSENIAPPVFPEDIPAPIALVSSGAMSRCSSFITSGRCSGRCRTPFRDVGNENRPIVRNYGGSSTSSHHYCDGGGKAPHSATAVPRPLYDDSRGNNVSPALSQTPRRKIISLEWQQDSSGEQKILASLMSDGGFGVRFADRTQAARNKEDGSFYSTKPPNTILSNWQLSECQKLYNLCNAARIMVRSGDVPYKLTLSPITAAPAEMCNSGESSGKSKATVQEVSRPSDVPSHAVYVDLPSGGAWYWNSKSQANVIHVRYATGDELLVKPGASFVRFFSVTDSTTKANTYHFSHQLDWPSEVLSRYNEAVLHIDTLVS